VARVVNNNLCKTNQAKVDRWLVKYRKSTEINDTDYDYLEKCLNSIIKKDAYSLKDCSEKNIVEFYLNHLDNIIDNIDIYDNIFWDDVKKHVRSKLAAKYTSNKIFNTNNIDIYFNEIKREYIKTPYNESDNLEFCEENYDIFIKNNLKLVIECAKRYRNLGLEFEDLIQAGNEGLLKCLQKYKTTKANLRVNMLKLLNESELRTFNYDQAEELVRKAFVYGKNLDTTINKLPKEGFTTKFDFETWIKTNIKPASFASVAFMWIRAYIIIALNSAANIVHVPQSAQKNGTSMANIIRLDSVNPHTDDIYHDNQTSKITEEEFLIEDENLEAIERQNIFKELIDNSLYCLSNVERRIVKKRFGIDYPYELSINDIAENENLSANKVKYIINSSLKKIANYIPERDKKTIMELLK
jgi:RNA polymerase sigma factor (sigma-70 family)